MPDEDPTPNPQPTPPAPQPAPPKPPWGDNPDLYDPEKAASLIAGLRADKAAADQRTADAVAQAVQTAQAEFTQKIGKSLGLVADDTPASAEEVTASIREKDDTITAQADRIKELTATNAVLRFAGDLNADVTELTDSTSFQRKLVALDTSASDYDSQVEALIKDAVDNNARFRKTQVASRSGGETPPSGGLPSGDPDDIEALRKKRLEERSK
ncbi:MULTISPECIES: hypothetical protein [Microbacterium]|uniref:hypothetical protein n=1 Tax=Microbacterium TaxID=33882 RepID=UPI001C2BE0A4|nr:hypothetical protein [Microbacterium paraoxydans]QXE28939.1 hypothetical protein IZR02_11110 [Microbacterium paraoxydans]